MTVYRKNISINVGETFSEDLTLLSADGIVKTITLQYDHFHKSLF